MKSSGRAYQPNSGPHDGKTSAMKLSQWIDERTGVVGLIRAALYEHIPGGARWRYVWGSTLVFVFALQMVTGVLLMTAYSPSATTAWGSVWFIQTGMPFGWLIRGLHHFGSQAMVILLPIHMCQVVLAKAYRAPREVNWWLGLGLAGSVLGLSLTGYLLPWDQKGYWATKVATNIMGLTPVVGDVLQRVVVGGSEYGHATLTRFYAVHVWLLPATIVILLAAHIALFRRHGVTCEPVRDDERTGVFWPDQVFKDSVACGAIFAVILGLVCYNHFAGGDAMLDAPADPTSSDYPARPEWYFLFLFQMLKYFEGPTLEVIGAIMVPGAVAAVLFIVPLLDRVLPKRFAHFVVVTTMALLLTGAIVLTSAALSADRDPTEAAVTTIQEKKRRGDVLTPHENDTMRAAAFNRQRAYATKMADRALELAGDQGIPPQGPLALLGDDPMTQGPKLFAAHCSACHRFNGHDGLGSRPQEPATSSDLYRYASRRWIRGLLDDPMAENYFGLMKTPDGEPAHTKMSKWVVELFEDVESEQEREKLRTDLDAVAAYLEDESKHPGRLSNVIDAGGDTETYSDSAKTGVDPTILRGRQVFLQVCNECHSYRGERSGTFRAPEMYGYGSVDWIETMMADPADDARYRSRGREPARMPAFKNDLTEKERRMIAEWIHAGRGV